MSEDDNVEDGHDDNGTPAFDRAEFDDARRALIVNASYQQFLITGLIEYIQNNCCDGVLPVDIQKRTDELASVTNRSLVTVLQQFFSFDQKWCEVDFAWRDEVHYSY